MHQQYSQSHPEHQEYDSINDLSEPVNYEDSNIIQQSPTYLNIRRPSNLHIQNQSKPSIKSKTEFIKVSKCNKNPQNQQNNKIQSTHTIVKNYKKQCRICLEDQAEGRIVKPCKCTGSMQFAHEHCLSQWIKRKVNLKTRQKVHCQVCEYPFDYKISKRLSLSCQVLKQNYEKFRSNYLCFFIVMFILILIWLTIFMITVIGFSASPQNWIRQFIMQAEQTRIVLICVVLVYLMIIGFVSLLFLAEYGVKTQFVIKNVQNLSRKSKKIVPKLYYIAT